ncbi:hypothetical protein [Halalkalibacter hemicellulosilyticus]|uniref:hypothetical protein n=1 Tax=Halalkalibacter hemicellulosilyticus TaxID=127886 RepID=UPI0005573660|nr:hypothetical protein [Halalkalibacter hemicellulosilyticus]
MEKRVEQNIDRVLESLSSQLYIGSVIVGILLSLFGLYVVIRKSEKKSRRMIIIGAICLGLGILALLSGIFQLMTV